MSEVIEVTSAEQLAAYRLPWNALWMQSRCRPLTQSFDWFTAYWKTFSAGRQLRVLLVLSDQQPVGILPLACSERRSLLGRERVLSNAVEGHDAVGCAIGPHPTATYAAGLRYLAGRVRDWDALEINQLPRGGELSRCQTAMQWAGLHNHTVAQGSCVLIELNNPARTSPDTVDPRDVLAGNCGRVEFSHYTPQGAACGEGTPDWSLLDACVDIDASWLAPDGKLTPDNMLEASRREFHLESFVAAVKYGLLDLALLTVDSQPVAYGYGYREADTLAYQVLRHRFGAEQADMRERLLARHLTASAALGMRHCRLSQATAAHASGRKAVDCQQWRVAGRSGVLPHRMWNQWRRWDRCSVLHHELP